MEVLNKSVLGTVTFKKEKGYYYCSERRHEEEDGEGPTAQLQATKPRY